MDTQQKQLVEEMALKLPENAQMTHMYPQHCARSEVVHLHILQTVAFDGVTFVRTIAQCLGITQELYTLDFRYYNDRVWVNCNLITDIGDTKFVISVRGQQYCCPTIKGFTPNPLDVKNYGWQVNLTSQELALY